MRDIVNHYSRYKEEDRLSQGRGPLELVRTQELLMRYLPNPPATVLDVGGGLGVYSAWLASKGYRVHLVDITPRLVRSAKDAFQEQNIEAVATAEVGDARSLSHQDESYDAILLMGPMYHLVNREDRANSLDEARRVLKRNGLLFVAAIHRLASLLDGIVRDIIDDPDYLEILERDLADGQHRNPSGDLDFFTTAVFHRPEELEAEVKEAGFKVELVAAIEGFGSLVRDFEHRWTDPARRELLLGLIRKLESDPTAIGLGHHFAVIGRK